VNIYQQYKAVISLSLPANLLHEVDELTVRLKKPRSNVVRQLIDVGLFIERKMGLVETWKSEDIEEIKREYQTGQLVDWIAQLELRDFSALMHIFEDEKKARGIKK